MTAILLFFARNPLFKKIAVGIGIALALAYGYRLITNRAYEQGQRDGNKQAWVDAEKAQRSVWETAQSDIKKQYADLVEQDRKLRAQQVEIDKQQAANAALRDQAQKQIAATVAQAQETLKVAPVQDDGLPAKSELVNAMGIYKKAYDLQVQQTATLQRDYDAAVADLNQQIKGRDAQLEVTKADLAQTQKQLDFYTQAFHGVTKKPGGFGHVLKKIFTLGIAR